MPANITITGTAGAGQAVTAVPFTGVGQVLIDFDRNILTMFSGPSTQNVGNIPPPLSVAAATTVTATKSGNNWTLTIS